MSETGEGVIFLLAESKMVFEKYRMVLFFSCPNVFFYFTLPFSYINSYINRKLPLKKITINV